MNIKVSDFGKCENGYAKEFTLSNSNGMSAVLTNYGAVIISLFVPDKNGNLSDVVLGFDSLEKYSKNHICYFGSTVGRNSNRVKDAQFVLDGVTYDLDKNERNKNNLHSGFNPYNERLWDYEINKNNNSVKFSLVSPDGDQGFPGNFDVSVTYTLTDDNEIKIEYTGKCDKDTVANMTNHSYFNLAGHNSGTAVNQTLSINADKYLEVDDELIPTGNLIDVTNTPLDFRTPKKISRDLNEDYVELKYTNGFDHSFAINKSSTGIEKVAVLSDEDSGRTMEVYTDCVGIQFYAGNFIENNTDIGKENCSYKNRSGICLETGFFPNAINEKKFVSPVLKQGDTYNSTTIYKFIF